MSESFDKIIEIAGVAVGLVYLYLEYRASIYLWIAGVVMPAIYIYIYWKAGLYADFGINVYYCLAAVYGLAVWLRSGRTRSADTVVVHTPRRHIVPLAVVSLLFFAAISVVLVNFTDSNVPYVDALTTALSVVALWMLAKGQAEQWIVWVVVDLVSAGLYVYKGLYPTAALYALYTVVAVFGYFKWIGMIEDAGEEDRVA